MRLHSIWHPGLRLRILAPAALVAIPAIALLLYATFDRWEQVEHGVTEQAERLASLKTVDQERLIEGTRQLLIAVAQSRDVRQRDREACGAYLSRIARHFGDDYTNLAVIDAQGAVTCSGVAGAGRSAAGRDYFRRAASTKGFVIGEFTAGTTGGGASLPFAFPVLTDTGEVEQVVFASRYLPSLNRRLSSADWPAEATIIVTDRAHTILAMHPGGEQLIGRSLQTDPVTARFGSRESGAVEFAEGTATWISAFRRVEPLDSGITVRVRLSKSDATAAATGTMYGNLLVFALAAFVIMAGVHMASDRLLLRPIAQLARASRRLAAGDLGARVATSTTIPELQELATDFDGMATALEEREKERLLSEMARNDLEEQYHRAQKMDAIGRLAGGIAHDFNNVLTAILGYCELLLEDTHLPQRHQDDILQIQKAGTTAEQLTRQLLAFSRREALETVVLDVNAIVSAVGGMLDRLVGEHIAMERALAPGLLAVKADRGQIEQVVLNLALNARDSMPGGGRISITTANVHVPIAIASAHLTVPAGNYVMLSVEDTGTGIPPEVMDHLFEPFFTTKDAGKGTGLGLATVYGIVKQNSGGIVVESVIGRGTAFRIYLPGSDEQVADAAPTPGIGRCADGTATVLVVEDDPGIRELSAKILERSGYTVLVADGGDEARQVSERHDGVIDVLLSDVVMPGMNGPMVAEMLTRMRPGLKVVFMSGYAGDEILRHGVRAHAVPFLHKPFTAELLASKIVEVLG